MSHIDVYIARVVYALEDRGVKPEQLADAIAEMVRTNEVRLSVARNNAEITRRNKIAFEAGCSIHGVTECWHEDGHGGICDLCD